MEELNAALGAHRADTTEKYLFAASVSLVVMPLFLSRRKKRANRRRAAVEVVLKGFNAKFERLRARLDRNTGELIIEDHPRIAG